MAEQTIQSDFVPPEVELRLTAHEPKGVMKKNLKLLIYLGAAALVIIAAVFSGSGVKSKTHSSNGGHEPPQPALQDNTDNNVQDLKNQLAQERQKEAQMAAGSQIQDPATGLSADARAAQLPQAVYPSSSLPVSCAPGQPCVQQQYPYGQQPNAYAQQEISPEKEQAMQLKAKERELAYNARFASNLVFARPAGSQPGDSQIAAAGMHSPEASEMSPIGLGQSATRPSTVIQNDQKPGTTNQAAGGRSAEINIDSAVGQPYVIYEGLALDTILMNRLDGDAVGPVKVMVSLPVYSHDRQHVLIPDGTVVLGEARKIGSSGFGQQRRMAVVFHRMIMPDGYAVDLDQFRGLDQIGEEGLKDKVNNHYLQIFGSSIALGVISGAGEIEAGGGTITTSGSQAFATGASASVSQSGTSVLDRFIQIPPAITIREGHRLKVYFMQDMLLPAYENHTIPQTF